MLADEPSRVSSHAHRRFEALAPRADEAQRPVIQHPDIDPPFMHLAMMDPAQQLTWDTCLQRERVSSFDYSG